MLFILVLWLTVVIVSFRYPINAEYVQVFFFGNITYLKNLEGNGCVSCFIDFTFFEKCKDNSEVLMIRSLSFLCIYIFRIGGFSFHLICFYPLCLQLWYQFLKHKFRARRIMLSEETPGSYPRSMLGVSVYLTCPEAPLFNSKTNNL